MRAVALGTMRIAVPAAFVIIAIVIRIITVCLVGSVLLGGAAVPVLILILPLLGKCRGNRYNYYDDHY
ncbi:MAG: hypothetical protein JWP71_2083 [Mucilaginibacter sp.]|nr:hypothetical protein [Mucilaginibacter sp.]